MRAAGRLVILISALVLTACACRNGPSASAPALIGTVAPTGPVVVLHAGERAFPIRVELARTEPERERGLMYRNHLDADTGMLFIFERTGPLTFWMKNTFIPLDMIFIGADRRIVGIVDNAVPETETPRRVPGDSLYVLEIGGGLCGRLGVSAGSPVEFQGLPRDAAGN